MWGLAILALCGVPGQQVIATSPQERFMPTRDPPNRANNRLRLHPDDAPWSQIKPSRVIEYRDCFDGLQCARLLVPLEGSDGGPNSSQIAIAMIRRPAKVNVTDPRYGGALILNPGGPSASGIEALMSNGERLQDMVDASPYPQEDHRYEPSTAKYFDIISFDPRAVNHSVPQLNCFPNTLSRLAWSLGADAEGLIGSSDTSFDQKWSRYLSRSATCIKLIEEEGDDSIAYYMGTRSTVDDIVAIAEQHGAWREAEARKLLSDEKTIPSYLDPREILEKTRWRHEKEPILFWGTSYGTILGSTLAAIYGDRIHRLVLDSVVSPDFFFKGSPENSLNHADEVLGRFVHLCHKYGPKICKFYRDTEEQIVNDMNSVLSNLREAPIAVPGTLKRGPDTITFTDMEKFLSSALYRPHRSFSILGRFLQEASEGNGSHFADYKAAARFLTVADAQSDEYTLAPQCKKDGPYTAACTQPNAWLEESMLGISCGDGPTFANITKDGFRDHWTALKNQSHALGDVWAEWDLMCVGWTVETKRKYEGAIAGDTANPILFVGNTLDPVCPIENAYSMAMDFSKSYVLEQRTSGHSIFTAQSTCTDSVIRRYFQGKKIYPKTECNVDLDPFEAEARHDR